MADASEREVIEFRAKHKEMLKNEFRRRNWDPFHYTSKGGSLFDPAIQRYMSMRACQYDHFKVTRKTTVRGALWLVPFVVLGYFVRDFRLTLEEDCRTGKIAYKDRKCKFI